MKIIREEGGWKGLYRGLTPTALGVGPYVAFNFTIYGSHSPSLYDLRI